MGRANSSWVAQTSSTSANQGRTPHCPTFGIVQFRGMNRYSLSWYGGSSRRPRHVLFVIYEPGADRVLPRSGLVLDFAKC